MPKRNSEVCPTFSHVCDFYLITEAATKGLLCKIGVLTILAKSLKTFVKEYLIKNEFLYKSVLSILLTLSI